MPYPGIWMTESEQILYRVVPKAACSSIGQILYYTEHGTFFDGDIHDARHGIHKWALEHSQPLISRAVESPDTYKFSCVRNPYQRILSSFFDKICGVQRSGGRYRETLVPFLIENYDIEVGGEDGKQAFDQIRSFRRFLLFARDTIRWHRPMAPDIHWSSIADHLATLVVNGAGSTVFFGWNGLMMACSRYLIGSRPHILSTSLLCRASTSHKCTGLNVRIRWPIILMICPCI